MGEMYPGLAPCRLLRLYPGLLEDTGCQGAQGRTQNSSPPELHAVGDSSELMLLFTEGRNGTIRELSRRNLAAGYMCTGA